MPVACAKQNTVEVHPLATLRLEDRTATLSSIHRSDRTIQAAMLRMRLQMYGKRSPSSDSEATVSIRFAPIS